MSVGVQEPEQGVGEFVALLLLHEMTRAPDPDVRLARSPCDAVLEDLLPGNGRGIGIAERGEEGVVELFERPPGGAIGLQPFIAFPHGNPAGDLEHAGLVARIREGAS
jgi:hypothetical protein